MKKFLLIISTFFYAISNFAQNQTECEKIATLIFQSVSKQEVAPIKPYLAEDFTIAGQTSPIAEKVLEQLVGNLGNVKKFNLTSVNTAIGLILNYDVEYEKFGKKQAWIEFDQNNKIKKLELLKIEVKTAQTDASKIAYNPSNVIEIPFTTMENLIIVKAFVNGTERDFILDSGAGLTILNSKYIENDSENDKTILSNAKGVHNESLSGTNLTKSSVDFYGIRIDNQEIVTYDISHLEHNNKQIYGLIGFDFLSKYDVLYNYAESKVILINSDYFQTYKKEKFAKNSVKNLPLEWRGHIPILPIKIGNNHYKMGIDSGAGVNLLDIALFPELKNNLKKISTDNLSGISQTKKEVTSALLKKFYVGTSLYKNTKTTFSNISHLNKDKEMKLDGILGYEFLSKQQTLLSVQREELLLIK